MRSAGAHPRKALLLERIHGDAVKSLKKAGYAVREIPKALPDEELAKELESCSLLGIRSKTRVTKEVLERAPHLLSVGAFCIGTNQIDLAAATERGVAVFNAPFQNTRSVVELAIAEMIMLLRKAVDKNAAAHRGEWDKSAGGCFEARGKTLGIVGYGHIGSQLSVIAENLGMRVIFYDTEEKMAMGNAHACKSLSELLKASDIVTLHVDGRPENKNLLGKKELRQMKKGAYLLNLSRGHIVDIEALAAALQSGHLAGAALDVYPKEPHGNDDRFVSALQHMPNTILTPHIGGSTEEAQVDIARYVSGRLLNYVDTGSTAMSVNVPVIRMSAWKDTHRIVHLHKNVPGILAKINDVFASRKINILGQQLNTNDQVGYVMTDVAKNTMTDVLGALEKIPHTLRTRLVY